MIPARPYLLRAMHEWLVDNSLTPYILVNAEDKQAEVPRNYVENGKIVLNISPNAVKDLLIDNEWVSFNARFSGHSMAVIFPIRAVMAIFAQEANDKGMVFQAEEFDQTPPPSKPTPPTTSTTGKDRPERKKPALKVVK